MIKKTKLNDLFILVTRKNEIDFLDLIEFLLILVILRKYDDIYDK